MSSRLQFSRACVPVPARVLAGPVPVLVLVLAATLSGCSRPKPPAPKPAGVGVVVLDARSVTVSDTLTGRTVATTSSDVRPQVDGIITARLFTEGSEVKRGQALYQIDPRLYKAALDTARAQLENARAVLADDQDKARRYRTLTENQAVSRQTIDDAVSAAAAALATVHLYEAAVETAQVNLGYTRVYAPISGRISRSASTPGALATAAQTTALATIQQLDPIYVDVTESAQMLVQLRQALARGAMLPSTAPVTLSFEDGTVYPQTGTLEFNEVTVDQTADTVTLRTHFPNPQGLLLPGMFVSVSMPQATMPNAILAPQQGIARDPKGNATALVVGADNKVEQREVTATRTIGTNWLVTRGLAAGDRLIVQGTGRATAGAVVQPTVVTLPN